MPRPWVVLILRLPSKPSRHRVGIWRELRRFGAVQLAPGSWALSSTDEVEDVLARIRDSVDEATGDLTVLTAEGRSEVDVGRITRLFTEAREDEWRELSAECERFLAEIKKEESKGKFTVAELEEEEQSLERLRRWHREVRLRDRVGAPSAAKARKLLKDCESALRRYEAEVFKALDAR